MQNPEKELPSFINALLQAPASEQRRLIEQHFTPDCRLTHALVIAENREEIIRVFQHWRFMNRKITATVNDILVDRSGNKVSVQLIQHVRNYLHSPISFHLPMSTLLFLKDSPRPGGGKLICKQVDYHSFEGMFYTMPLVGAVFEHVFRRILTFGIIQPARLAAATWPLLDQLVRTTVPEAAASWEACKAMAARLWWRQEPWDGGRTPAPYYPQK